MPKTLPVLHKYDLLLFSYAAVPLDPGCAHERETLVDGTILQSGRGGNLKYVRKVDDEAEGVVHGPLRETFRLHEPKKMVYGD